MGCEYNLTHAVLLSLWEVFEMMMTEDINKKNGWYYLLLEEVVKNLRE
ncbi:MAG: hypothetical protein HUJ74_03635 [Lachnospiraceae bacterium]|nr:hypothetical protein [Lachnospiraceae bacterium]